MFFLVSASRHRRRAPSVIRASTKLRLELGWRQIVHPRRVPFTAEGSGLTECCRNLTEIPHGFLDERNLVRGNGFSLVDAGDGLLVMNSLIDRHAVWRGDLALDEALTLHHFGLNGVPGRCY